MVIGDDVELSNINWLAVFVSAVVAFIIGGFWFSPKAFFPLWWRTKARSAQEVPGSGLNMGLVFGSTFLALLVQATVMATILELMKTPGMVSKLGVMQGATTGLIVGVGIAAASSLTHRLFGGDGFKIWAIEVGNDILNLVAIGAILALWS